MTRAGIAVVLAGALALGACKRKEAARSTTASEPVVTVGPENVTTATLREIRSGPVISGSLRAEQEATVRAQASGTVEGTSADAGQRVRRGQVLARINETAVRDAYLSAKSAVRTAEATLENARRNAERSERLAQAGAVAERDLETARWNVTNAEGTLADARARLASAAEQLEHTVVRAPITGIVSEREADAGDVVQLGATLFTIVDPRDMRLEASVPANQIGRLKVGTPVEFTVSGYDRHFTGRVQRINPVVDPATGQVRIYVGIPNEERTLVGGLFAQGRVATETKRAVTVPAGAVDTRGVTPVVHEVRNGRVQETPVELGIRDEVTDLVEVRSGVAAGDTLLLGSAQGVTPGARVRVLEEEAGR
jgi:RND family efflux transporter MFP subunit